MQKEVKTHIEVDGVILTPEALDTLRNWQSEDNSSLKFVTECLADSVCLMARIDDAVHVELQDKAQLCNYELSLIRDEIKSLKKP